MSKVVHLPLVLMPHCKSAILLASCQDAERRNFFDSLVTFGDESLSLMTLLSFIILRYSNMVKNVNITRIDKTHSNIDDDESSIHVNTQYKRAREPLDDK